MDMADDSKSASNDGKPHFVPDEKLMPRDNSGGPGFTPYNAKMGDGDKKTGPVVK